MHDVQQQNKPRGGPRTTSTILRDRILRIIAYSLIPAVLIGTGGCTAARYRKRADRETYRIIEQKSKSVKDMEEDFTLERDTSWNPLEGLPILTESDESLGPNGGGEVGAPILSLEQTLRVAVRNSRTYQNRKEALYLEALSLTLDRHRYTPIFSAAAGGAFHRTARDVEKSSGFSLAMDKTNRIIDDFEQLTGTPADLLNQYATLVETAGQLAGWDQPRTEIRRESSVRADTNVGVNLLLRGGGKIALGLTSNFLRFMTGDSRVATSSVLTGTFTQPVLRGAGAKVAAEQLTQSERDVLYALRDFTHFRKEFTVDICSAYYGVLQARDVVRNNWQSLKNFQRNVERERAFAAEGRRTQAELGRLEQALLNTENGWINSVRQYKESLDRFKILLGLSTDAQLVLDDKELEQLRRDGLRHPDISAEDAVQVALAARLDLYNQRDSVDDSQRKIKVAVNALKPDLDFFLTGQVASAGEDNFQELNFKRLQWSAGADLDLALDRKAERNAYRSALIAHDRALREYSLAEDNIKLEVRAAWRNLDQARRNFEIAEQSVALSQRRVEEQDLLAELGRATVLNQVDAQNDLTRSQNELTEALINHTIARLAFWRDMGILYIKKDGQWEEVTDGYPQGE